MEPTNNVRGARGGIYKIVIFKIVKIRCPGMLISRTPFGGRVVVNGAALALCHIPGFHIFEQSRFLKKRFRLKIVSTFDLAGSRGARRKYF